MSEVFYEVFETDKVKCLHEGINLMQSGDVLNLRNLDANNKSINIFADSLLKRNFESKFLVSCLESNDGGTLGLIIGRTVA